jgi:hypothetical protein
LGSKSWIFRTDRLKANCVMKALGDGIGPVLELRASPLKSMITVPELACR